MGAFVQTLQMSSQRTYPSLPYKGWKIMISSYFIAPVRCGACTAIHSHLVSTAADTISSESLKLLHCSPAGMRNWTMRCGRLTWSTARPALLPSQWRTSGEARPLASHPGGQLQSRRLPPNSNLCIDLGHKQCSTLSSSV